MTISPRFGGAVDAADVLGVSRAQLDRVRASGTYVYDPGTGSRRRPTTEEASDRAWLSTQHLIAPSLFAQKLPRGVWEYDLVRLRRQREDPRWLDDESG